MKKTEIDILQRFDIGIRRGVAKALAEHKRLRQPIFIWENGKVVKVPPEKIIIPECPELD